MSQQPHQNGPTTPHMQHLSAITHIRFGLIRFRSPLLTESLLFSVPVGTEMFHFPTFPPTALYIQAEVAGHDSGHFQGFPIRKSPDQSSFTSSPGLIAGYNVLHRLLVPRHPPIALSSLSQNNQQNLLQRCSRPLCSSQDTGEPRPKHPPTMDIQTLVRKKNPTTKATDPSGPNSALQEPPTQPRPFHTNPKEPAVLNTKLRISSPTSQCSTHKKPHHAPRPTPDERSTKTNTPPKQSINLQGSLERR